MASISPVGHLLRSWRASKGMSQLDLALRAGVSPRHLSFIETGRSSPSREMLVALSEALDVPFRERNVILLAAGYAALYRETPLDAPEMGPVRRVLDIILGGHGSCPALVINARYEILRANTAASLLLARIVAPEALGDPPLNLLRLLLSERGLRDHIENWEEVAIALTHRVEREAVGTARSDLEALLHELLGAVFSDKLRKIDLTESPQLLIPMRLRVRDQVLSLFSTITTLGTPLDVTLQELRIEALFPADEESARILSTLRAEDCP